MGEGAKNLEFCERASVGSTRVAAFPTGYHPHSDLHGIHSRSLPAPENDTISRHKTYIQQHNEKRSQPAICGRIVHRFPPATSPPSRLMTTPPTSRWYIHTILIHDHDRQSRLRPMAFGAPASTPHPARPLDQHSTEGSTMMVHACNPRCR